MIARSVVAGLAAGAFGAVVLLVDTTVRQPNFVPASFSFSIPVLGPYLLVGGLTIGALVGLVAGIGASAISSGRARRITFVVTFAVATAVAVLLVFTHPLGNFGWDSVPARAIVLGGSILVALVSAGRVAIGQALRP